MDYLNNLLKIDKKKIPKTQNAIVNNLGPFATIILPIIKEEQKLRYQLRYELELATSSKKWNNSPSYKYDTRYITSYKILYRHYKESKIFPQLNDYFFVKLGEYFMFVIKQKYPSVVVKLEYNDIVKTYIFRSNIIDLEDRLIEIFREIAI